MDFKASHGSASVIPFHFFVLVGGGWKSSRVTFRFFEQGGWQTSMNKHFYSLENCQTYNFFNLIREIPTGAPPVPMPLLRGVAIELGNSFG
tara:strand:- start:8 stop:280 length:273 start_codon:yes stop_codon:yes gene_type:complete